MNTCTYILTCLWLEEVMVVQLATFPPSPPHQLVASICALQDGGRNCLLFDTESHTGIAKEMQIDNVNTKVQ